MILLTWRQHRMELLILIGLVAAIAAILLVTGQEIHQTYDTSGMAHCVNLATWSYTSDCGRAADAFLVPYTKVYSDMMWLNLLPLCFGILLGVPLLAREYEQGTYKFIWTQSLSQRRWLLTKIAVLLTVVLALSMGISAVMTWWDGPFDAVFSRFGQSSWDFEGLMPAAFAVFAFALGTAAGAAFRRVVPAVAVVFAYIPVWLAADLWLRTVVPPPISHFYALGKVPALPRQDWTIMSQTVDRAGHPFYGGIPLCSDGTLCANPDGLRVHQVFQPASRFWEIQAVEASILIGLALLLLMFAVWRVRARAR